MGDQSGATTGPRTSAPLQSRNPLVPGLAALVLLSTCTTQAQRENAATQKEAAAEIKRICALPPTERAAELERIRKESVTVVTCGKQQAPDA